MSKERDYQGLLITNNKKFFRIGSKLQGKYIDKSQIVYIEAFESYSWIYLKDGSEILSSKNIGTLEESFKDISFIRIHRSYLINPNYVQLYEPHYRLVHLTGEIVLPISHRKNRIILKMVGNTESNTPFRIAM
ncbi:LytR/AlgR family response regulator transcription factor [Kordia zhangzhouensis]|uniref:LytR/AlgR family response regulator transcription factor n=1 Tax=Kordia zhangzhouensis TaxID=1620405 RepID=UPI000629A7E5|nr:LytTR family DNA-binding domain-containing protein [Kordia zhangzhouensis]